MEKIKETVERIMRSWETSQKGPGKHNPEELLNKALTKKERGHIKFNYFRRGTLNISVDSSVWLYQLSLHKEGLLSKLQKKLSGIKEIRFSLGDIRCARKN